MNSGGLKVLIAYRLLHIGARIIQRVSRIPNVEIVAEAQGGDEVLLEIEQKKPDLVILDMFLSNATGLETLKKIKRLSPATLVVMTSTSAFPLYRRECVKDGADYFFALPDEIEELNNAVVDLAGRADRLG